VYYSSFLRLGGIKKSKQILDNERMTKEKKYDKQLQGIFGKIKDVLKKNDKLTLKSIFKTFDSDKNKMIGASEFKLPPFQSTP